MIAWSVHYIRRWMVTWLREIEVLRSKTERLIYKLEASSHKLSLEQTKFEEFRIIDQILKSLPIKL